MMNGIPEKLSHVLKEFDEITDLDERASRLIDYAEHYREVPPGVASRPYPESHRVPYCESEAYVWAVEQPDHTVKLHFAVENPSGISAKALAAILEETTSGSPPEALAALSTDIVGTIFRQNISMGKGMGLMGIIQRVQSLGRQLLRKNAG